MKTMNLQKKSDVPSDIKTKPEDVAVGLDELIMFLGQHISILLYYDDGNAGEISSVACGRMYDLAFYAAENKIFPQHIDEDNAMLLSAAVLDPEDLPFSVESDEEVFVIYEEWDFNRYEYTYPSASIEDFIVLSGKELSERPKKALIRRVEYWRDIR
jgi:hypothetical protein